MVKWLKHCDGDQHGLNSKPTHAILLCPWERHSILPCLVVLASSSKSQSYLNKNKKPKETISSGQQ